VKQSPQQLPDVAGGLFDTHVHFDLLEAGGDVAGVLARAAAAGVNWMLAIGHNAASNVRAVALAGQYRERARAAVGLDRENATADVSVAVLEKFVETTPPGLVVAVGEIGLDYHHGPETAAAQRRLFQAQLELAARVRLPVIVHSREAEQATLELLGAHARNSRLGDRVGVLHCFTGGLAFARPLLDLGYVISFSGIVTFRNAGALREVARFVPAERLLIETDSPYLAPVPHRGRPNEPALLPAIAACLAEIRGCVPEELARITTANAARLFGWPGPATAAPLRGCD